MSWKVAALVSMGLVASGLAGCNPQSTGAPPGSASAPAPTASATEAPAKKAATAAQWHEAVNKAFDKVDVDALRKRKAYVLTEGKTDEDGINSFFTCFDQAPPACDMAMSGKRDPFRKIQFFDEPIGRWNESGAEYEKPGPKPTLRAYLSLRDCKAPSMLVVPVFRARSNWLFMEQVSVMADGALVLDRKLSDGQVDRDTDPYSGLKEEVHVVLTEGDVEALRKLPEASNVIIRITGKKGYVTLDKKYTQDFAKEMRRVYVAYDALTKASKSVGSVEDPACP